MAFSMAAGLIVKVLASVSQKTTVPPACVIMAEVLIHECAVVNDFIALFNAQGRHSNKKRVGPVGA
jgi:hypothetical protein